MTTLSDLALVKRVTILHDRKAFNRLVEKYQSPIRRFFLNMTGGDTMTSDDLAQDTFIKAYTKLSQFRATATFSTWLYRIAYNVFYDYKRKESHAKTTDINDSAALAEDRGSHGIDTRYGETTDTLSYDFQQALAILNSHERVCITLQLIDGFAISDIAEATGMPEGTIKSHLSRGKSKLAIFLRNNGYE